MNATFRCSGCAALISFESRLLLCSSGSVLTSMGCAAVSAFMSDHMAVIVLPSSGWVCSFIYANGYT